MKRRPVIGLALVAATVVLVMLPGAAMAMAPTSHPVQLHLIIPSYVSCDSFQVIADVDITRTDVTFYDNSGTPIRQVFHVDIIGTVANSVTGVSLPATRHGIVTVDLVTGTLTGAGQVIHVNAPGSGAVLLDVGRYTRDAAGNLIFEAGPHPIQSYVDGDSSGVQELCAALS